MLRMAILVLILQKACAMYLIIEAVSCCMLAAVEGVMAAVPF
jgi:hypothetical protein